MMAMYPSIPVSIHAPIAVFMDLLRQTQFLTPSTLFCSAPPNKSRDSERSLPATEPLYEPRVSFFDKAMNCTEVSSLARIEVPISRVFVVVVPLALAVAIPCAIDC